MGYMAKWGPKGFLVSPSKVVPFNDLKTSYELKEDSENDTSGTPPTNTRGRQLQTITFSTVYMKALGTDPRGQMAEWYAELGKAYPLYIGGRQFGPPLLKLKKVELSDYEMNNEGDFLKMVVSITLEEYSEGKKSKLADTKATSGNTKSASSSTSVVQALNITASATDKAAKKPYTAGTRGPR